MPNQNYCGAREDFRMTDCSLPLPYTSVKSEEKYCKYSYTSWCPTCDKDSPRRRTRSETNEPPCRRKGKEMKTFTPKKKYNKCREFENMELEEHDNKELRFDCCRMRANLCELPTTYIANNCQIYSNPSNLTKVSSGNSDYFEKPTKSIENPIKPVDFNSTDQNLFAMDEKPIKGIIKNGGVANSPGKNDYWKNFGLNGSKNVIQSSEPGTISPRKDLWTAPKLCSINGSSLNSKYCSREARDLLSKYTNSNLSEGSTVFHYDHHSKSKQNSPKYNIVDLKYDREINDTCTFFDKREYDTTALNDKYFKEVQLLRAKLQEIKKKKMQQQGTKSDTFGCQPKEVIKIESEDTQCNNVKIVTPYKFSERPQRVNVENGRQSDDTKVSATQNDVTEKRVPSRKVKGEKSKCENLRPKLSVKPRSKRNSMKIRQIARSSKVTNNSSLPSGSQSAESDANDADISDKEEGGNAEESECSVECSKVSVKECGELAERTISRIGAGDSAPCWPLRESLFPHIPPYINFNEYDAETPFNLPPGRRYLKWKLSTITPIVVRKTLQNTGFQLIRKSNEWLGTWGKHMKSPMFKTLKEVQKLNHFPGTFQLGRKDRLWRNLQRLMLKFGQKEFGFTPQTFVLPQDLKLLKQCWEHKNGSGEEIFIIKPPASARGTGIKVINKWSQLPKKTSIVVQRYISNPYLINGSKFDLRLYVLVTSFNPLRIYLYPDGLARFASAKYSDNVKDLKDRYMHLTNYSINKLSSQYTANEDANACQGHKWTLSKLWEFMEKDGIDTKSLWKNLEALVIKTMISAESPISMLCKENLTSRYNSYELFGVDVLLDDRLKPWLLEVNISPSLHSSSPLDAHVKGPMVKALFDMAQFHLPTRLSKTEKSPLCFDARLYTMALTKRERNKHNYFSQVDEREEYLDEILEGLTGDDVRHLTQAEDELTVMGPFKKIFPTSQTHRFLPFLEVRYYNRLFDAWESRYERNRKPGIEMLQTLCSEKIHLKVATQSHVTKSLPSMIPVVLNLEPALESQNHLYDSLDNHKLTTVVSS